MKKLVNGFVKGLDKDTPFNKDRKNSLYHNQNFRILTQEDSSNGNLTLVKGNTEINCSNNYEIPGCEIIGHCTIKEDIVLFWALSIAENVDDYTKTSYITVLKNLSDNTYISINLWAGKGLNFRIDKPIRAVSRWEKDSVRKVYWTDDNNPIRFINISPDLDVDGNLTDDTLQANYTRINALDKTMFDLVPSVNYMESIFFEKYIGGNLDSGIVQYVYRLQNKNGQYSNFSQESQTIPVFKGNYNKYTSLRGTDKNINTSKGIIASVILYPQTIKFDYLEIVGLYYSELYSEPTVKVIEKIQITDTDLYTFIDDGNNYIEELTYEEFLIDRQNYIAKDLAIQDNSLFIGNIKENIFDVEYDARAYRFSFTGTVSRLYSQGSVEYTLIGPNPDYSIVAKDADAINPSNYNDNRYCNTNEYIYNADRSAIGGSGPNVSYRLVTLSDFKLDETVGTFPAAGGKFDADINSNDFYYVGGINKGFHLDEIYRFGLTFINGLGQASFVKWIGDIRMTPYTFTEHIAYLESSTEVASKLIVPQFNITNIPIDPLTGLAYNVQIVYVKREDGTRSVYSQGLLGTALQTASTITSKDAYAVSLPLSFGSVIGGSPADKKVCTFISPEIVFNTDFSFDNKSVKPIGRQNLHAYESYDFSSGGGYSSAAKFLKVYSYVYDANLPVKIIDFRKTSYYDTRYYNSDTRTEESFLEKALNIGVHAPINPTFFLHLEDEILGEYTTPFPGKALLVNIISTDNSNQFGGFDYESRSKSTYILGSYRIIGEGGIQATYGDTVHSMMEYQFRSHPLENISSSYDKPFYYFFPVQSQYNLNFRNDDSYNKVRQISFNDPSIGLGDALKVNPAFYLKLKDNTIYTDYNSETEGVVIKQYSDMYLYNTVYSKVTDSKKFFPKPTNFDNIIEFNSTIRYSDSKINGEDVDTWTFFKPNNFKQVNTSYGNINNLTAFRDNIFVHQDTAFGVLSISPRVTQVGEDGINTILGTGDKVDKMSYISTTIGNQGLNNIIESPSALYWIDINNKGIFRYSSQLESLAEMHNISSYCKKNIDNYTQVTGVSDIINNEIIFSVTNRDGFNTNFNDMYVTCNYLYGSVYNFTATDTSKFELTIGNIYNLFLYSGSKFKVIAKSKTTITVEVLSGSLASGGIYSFEYFMLDRNSFNLVFNEKLNVFQGFYRFNNLSIPSLYIRTTDRFFSSIDNSSLFEHNIGEYMTFYGTKQYAYFDIIVNLEGLTQLEANNIEFYSNVTNFDFSGYNTNIINETLTHIQSFNKYQESDLVTLYPMSSARYIIDTSGYPIEDATTFASLCNIRKNVEHWRCQVPRFRSDEDPYIDIDNPGNPTSDRFRSNYVRIRFHFKDNTGNNNITIQDIVTTVQELIL